MQKHFKTPPYEIGITTIKFNCRPGKFGQVIHAQGGFLVILREKGKLVFMETLSSIGAAATKVDEYFSS